MRITKEAKKKTAQKILRAAEKLFTSVGYKDTTTRQIAEQAGIATGTLFNYFPSKETLAMSLLAEEISQGREDYFRRRSDDEDFSEDLFLLISSEIRRLKPYRKFVGPVLESTMSLFSKETSCPAGDSTRAEHLQAVRDIIHNHGYSKIPDYISTSLYWSLYLGILAFWSTDESRNQEETLALMDYSINVFTQTISNPTL
ncbi:MAG: TetR/AcrR family transcriptional regulator [Thermodesulfobacteriota bacterium]